MKFKHTTPLGIKVEAAFGVPQQYEAHWNLPWDTVNRNKLDQIFAALKSFYNAPKAKAKGQKVKLHPWIDCTSQGKGLKMESPWGLVEGWYWENVNHSHMGDDNGQGENAFRLSALPHEWFHHFLWITKNEACFYGIDDPKNEACRKYVADLVKLGVYV